MGAHDNLTAIAIMMAIAKYLKTNKVLENTEIWLVSHGCEEIGDRGSKYFSKKYHEQIKNASVINIDMVGGKDNKLKIDTAEQAGLIKLSKELASQLSHVFKELKIDYEIGSVPAFTDSMAYSMNGIQTTSILGYPKNMYSLHYHTREDTIDVIDFENVYDCYRILVKFIEKLDKNEIKL